MSTLTLLHDPNNEASREFLAIFGDSGDVLSGPEQARAVCPAFPGFPCVIYTDSAGVQHALLSPADMTAVETWRAGIDNQPKPSVLTKYRFLDRFTQAELIAATEALAGNVPLQVGQKLLDATPTVDLTDPNILTYMTLLVQAGALTQDRATIIMTP